MSKRVSARKRAEAKVPEIDGTASPEIDGTASRARASWRDMVGVVAAEIESGVPMQPACVMHGVSYETVRDAIDRKDLDVEPIQRARAKLEAELAKALRGHALESRAHAGAAYMLERIAPKRWHRAEKLHVGGDDEAGPVRTEGPALSEAQLLARLDVLRSKLGGAK